jgi:hypothetical protein
MCEHGHVKKYRHVLEASQSQLSTHSPHSQLHLGIHMTTLAFAWNPGIQQMRHEVVHKQHHSAPLPATRLDLATALDRRPSRTPNKPLEPPLQSGHSITRNQVSATINSKKHQQTNKHKSHQPQYTTSYPTASQTATTPQSPQALSRYTLDRLAREKAARTPSRKSYRNAPGPAACARKCRCRLEQKRLRMD